MRPPVVPPSFTRRRPPSPLAAALPILLLLAPAPVSAAAPPSGPLAPSLRELYRRLNPSVVVIHIEEHDVSEEPKGGIVDVEGLGSGVLISADGKVLTAAHVVQDADRVKVEFLSGETVPAHVVAAARTADVALIQLEKVPKNPVVAKLGDSDRVEVGDDVFIIGAPYGLSHTLTVGHVSGRQKPKKQDSLATRMEFLQTDAAINEGNSGGPMFTMNGEVVGIVSAILTQSGGFEGIGFAATSHVVRDLLLERRSFWSGVEGALLDGKMAQALNVPQTAGYLVERVAKGSPAERLGLQGGTLRVRLGVPRDEQASDSSDSTQDGLEDFGAESDNTLIVGGDIILAINGVGITASKDRGAAMVARLADLKPGDRLTVKVLRAGKVETLSATVP